VLVAEHDLCGSLLDLVTAVLAMGDAVLTRSPGFANRSASPPRPLTVVSQTGGTAPDSDARAVHPAGTAGSHLPRLRLFSSRRPSQGRLRHRWRDSAATGPDTAPAPVGSGTCEGDGRD
jgi:hypothetical protein